MSHIYLLVHGLDHNLSKVLSKPLNYRKLRVLIPVIQEETKDCSITAVAKALGKTYSEIQAIANELGIYAEDPTLWSDTRYMRTLLSNAGISISDNEIPVTIWDTLPDTALKTTKHHQEEGKDLSHWMVFKQICGKSMVLDFAAYLDSNRLC